MSIRYKGGILSATPPTLVAGAGASGAWTLEQQMQATAAGNWPVNGPFYIEDVFSTWLYTGTGASQTITNGIDLAGKGGLTWFKSQSNATVNLLFDSARGSAYRLMSDSISKQDLQAAGRYPTYTSTGFTLGADTGGDINYSPRTYASWTFAKQPKFFDVVTWTGNGSYPRTISHSLGSVPGCIICKQTSLDSQWATYHTSLGNANAVYLNNTLGSFATSFWNSTTPTSTGFTIGATFNEAGETYVAYLFANNAGGFGLTGSDNVISCGSYTGNGTTNNITLGYEPQWLLVKRTDTASDWRLGDIMRGSLTAAPGTAGTPNLYPNLSSAEDLSNWWYATSTGFATYPSNGASYNASGGTYIYIAIRRGPMKVPTSGTSVFSPVTYAGNAGSQTITSGFPIDLLLEENRNKNFTYGNWAVDRLRGSNVQLYTDDTTSELSDGTYKSFASNTAMVLSGTGNLNGSGANYISWFFRRAPSFFDVVCYTGTGAGDNPKTFTHNLQVVPELMLIKRRNSTAPWIVYSASQGASKNANLNTTDAFSTANEFLFDNTSPTASVFTVGSINGASSYVNASGGTYVNYLFATCAGVSKVGSYTGTGALQTVNCGFTGGARFVLIKRTDSTGDWYVWDSARGISSGNDPYLILNGPQPVSENTTTNYVDTDATGFKVTAAAPAGLNAVGGTYIFLAIA